MKAANKLQHCDNLAWGFEPVLADVSQVVTAQSTPQLVMSGSTISANSLHSSVPQVVPPAAQSIIFYGCFGGGGGLTTVNCDAARRHWPRSFSITPMLRQSAS